MYFYQMNKDLLLLIRKLLIFVEHALELNFYRNSHCRTRWVQILKTAILFYF
jgi:hypothetical protein